MERMTYQPRGQVNGSKQILESETIYSSLLNLPIKSMPRAIAQLTVLLSTVVKRVNAP